MKKYSEKDMIQFALWAKDRCIYSDNGVKNWAKNRVKPKRKFSRYFKFLMFMAVLSALCAIVSPLPSVCAIFCTITLVLGFSAIMAPDEEKYKQH